MTAAERPTARGRAQGLKDRSLGGVNTLVVLDSEFGTGPRSRPVLEATRHWIDSRKQFYTSRNLSGGPSEAWGDGWLAFGGGVAYVEKTSDVKSRPVSRLGIPEDPLKPGLYHWDQTHQDQVYWLILILPSGTTLQSANPEPNDAGDLGDRFVIFWESISSDNRARNVDISWELTTYTGEDRDGEVNRLRARLPLSIRKKSSAFRRVTYMKRGVGSLFLGIALITAWISLPQGLAISPLHVPADVRIPATIACLISIALSALGLAKGWSLASFFVVPRAPKRDR
jgi:hypothetical protein